jgi:hypothetical protein
MVVPALPRRAAGTVQRERLSGMAADPVWRERG